MTGPVRKGVEDEHDQVDLIKLIAQGSEGALSKFYDRTSSQVFGLVLRIVGKYSAAEEITLEVFTSVWKRAGQYCAEDGTPSSWLFCLARRRAIDWLRSEPGGARGGEHKVRVEVVHDAATTRQGSAQTARHRATQEALRSIHPRQRAAIELAYFSGMTYGDIAERLGEPPGAVKTWVQLGMARLRQVLWS